MKHIYRRFILFALALILNIGAAFPQHIAFGYDAAGNRIKREIVISHNSNSLRKAPQKAFVTEMLSDKTIKIYPNPTKGVLKIEIVGWSEADNGTITIFNTNGAKLMLTSFTEPSVTIDLTGYTPGIYLMLITIGDKDTTWKIIKE